jgi:predicted O-linked N-acetylglucosamine transferase (SPINDLY family)
LLGVLAPQTLGELDEAVSRYQQVIAIVPGHPGALRNLGNALHALGHHEEAAHAYRMALALTPNIDLQLDPYPHTGGISTLDALLMGVPCVTLLGDRIPGRLSASFLTALGLGDLVARTLDEYVEIAARLARDTDRLVHEHATLRERLLASPILDAPKYARAVEDAYRMLWRRWCASQAASCE